MFRSIRRRRPTEPAEAFPRPASFRKRKTGSAQKSVQSRHIFVRFRFHDLRHLFAVRFLQNGGSIYALQGIMGRTSVKTTEIYLAHLTPDQQLKSKMG
ncbi:MAG TPA: site-specific integrase [Novosphingobium sp.]|nr:site-specific integrase [Novosphingobium sp.]HKR92239.1 site-specific integrase [Novosphingobium sp.]